MDPEVGKYPAVAPLSSFSEAIPLGQNASTGALDLLSDPATIAIAATAIAILVGAAAVASFASRRGLLGSGLPVWPNRVADHLEATRAHDELGDVFVAPGFAGEPCVFLRGEHAPKLLSSMGTGEGKWTAPLGAKHSGFIVPSNLVQPMVGPSFFTAAGEAWKSARSALRSVFVPRASFMSATASSAARAVSAAAPPGTKLATVDAQAVAHETLRDTMYVTGAGVTAAEAVEAERAFVRLEGACNDWRADPTVKHAREFTPAVADASDSALRACGRLASDAVARASAGDDLAAQSVAALLHASLVSRGATGPDALAEVSRTVYNLVVAGAESNAISTAKTLAAVAEDLDLVRRLQDEVDAAIEASGGSLDGSAVRASAAPLLDAVVREGLRLFVPATAAVRVTDREYAVRDGAVIPAGASVCVCFHALHRDPAVWPRPGDFDPSRFLAKRGARPRHAYLPFSAGPRKCPGEAVAMQQARLVLATVLRGFTPRPAAGGGGVPVDHAAGFTEWSTRGVPVALEARG